MPEDKDQHLSERERNLVHSTIASVMEQFAPLLKDIALTPEKLREANKPYVDPANVARELRLKEQQREQDKDKRANLAAQQANCTHKDDNEKWAFNLTHNFPDHMPRGECPLCFLYVEPAHWVIPGPGFDGGNGVGQPYITPAHPLYSVISLLESKS